MVVSEISTIFTTELCWETETCGDLNRPWMPGKI